MQQFGATCTSILNGIRALGFLVSVGFARLLSPEPYFTDKTVVEMPVNNLSLHCAYQLPRK